MKINPHSRTIEVSCCSQFGHDDMRMSRARPASGTGQSIFNWAYDWTAFTGGLMFILLGVAPGEVASQIHRSSENREFCAAFPTQAFAVAKEEKRLEHGT